MTEDEARKKWCPFARHTQDEAPVANRWDSDLNPIQCRCIASDCLAWRWRVTSGVEERMYHDVAAGKEPQREGYCGLAGKP